MKDAVFKYFMIFVCVTGVHNLYAQGEQKAIIFTGVVVGGKTTVRLPGAYIYTFPKPEQANWLEVTVLLPLMYFPVTVLYIVMLAIKSNIR